MWGVLWVGVARWNDSATLADAWRRKVPSSSYFQKSEQSRDILNHAIYILYIILHILIIPSFMFAFRVYSDERVVRAAFGRQERVEAKRCIGLYRAVFFRPEDSLFEHLMYMH